ncbi:MAG: flagellar biosynthesis protein FlhA [Solirubrobacteraceae bacterium]
MERSLRRLMAHTDLMAAVGVVLVVTMLVIPLPSTLLDLLITLNIAGALAIVVATMYTKRALDFSAFPTVLLLTTMFRLAINVSVTRLVLTKGDAGSVVRDFGQFVVGGDLIVGLVIFMILVIIQFVVVTNGSGRVAEVAARFTLDAMPGKQMAIDADLNAGLITDEQARHRRAEIGREADFYGAMDGASKFVKGDAMAAVIIVAINLLGGIAIGMLKRHMSISDAMNHYSLLTVGDGLCEQIPALLISVGMGIIVTRSAASRDLGSEIAMQILGQRKAPLVAGGAVLAFALVPGLPTVPFLVVGGALFAVGWGLRKQGPEFFAPKPAAPELPAGDESEPKVAPRDEVLRELPLDPLELGIGFGLVPLVDRGSGGTLVRRISLIRRQIAGELGMVIPPVRIHDEVDLDSHEYVCKVRGTEVARGQVMAGHRLAMDPGDAVGNLSGIPTTEPAFGLPAVWIAEAQHAEAEALGYTVVDSESVIVTHLTETIRSHSAQLLTRQDVRALLDQLKDSNEAVVTEVVPDILSVGEIQRVLQVLLSEGVSIRDLGAIVEAVGDKARITRDTGLLAEYARQALGRAITAPHLAPDHRLCVITLDPAIEQEVATSITQTTDGEYLALDPARAQALLGAVRSQSDQAAARGGTRPVLLCSARVRRHLRRLVESAMPHLPVCSYNEIASGISVETIGVISA